jgi:hypothetical protein
MTGKKTAERKSGIGLLSMSPRQVFLSRYFSALPVFCLIVLAVLVPLVSAVDLAGTGSDGTVTIARPAQVKYYIWEDTVTFSGTNTGSGTTYLFITGPNLKTNGAQIQSTHPAQSPVIDGDASTFLAAPVGPDTRWSYTWDTHNVMIDSGVYTIYAASTPRDLPHLNSTHSDRMSIIMAPPRSIVPPAGPETPAGSGTGTIAGKGYVTIIAAGSQAYNLGDEIQLSGQNTETYTTFLFLTGPNLPEQGSQIQNPDPRHWPVKNNDTASFKTMDVNGDRTWSWRWGTANYALDAGTYTIYAVSGPSDKDHLENAAYGTVSVIIRRPPAPATPAPAATAATPAPTRSPGYGALIALAGLGAVAFIVIQRRFRT